MEPKWLNPQTVDAIHNGQIRDHGGNSGVLKEGSVDSAIARDSNQFVYKRVFLYINGWHMRAPDEAKILLMLDVAQDVRNESDIAKWFEAHATSSL